MNLKDAQNILRLESLSKDRKRYLRDLTERTDFLKKWIGKYQEELNTLSPKLGPAKLAVDKLPSRKDVVAATELINEINNVDKEIRKYECKRRSRRSD